MPIAIEERSTFFEEHLRIILRRYRIHSSPHATALDYCRFAYLCSTLVVKMYDSRFGQDAYVWFYNWAQSKKIVCGRLEDEKYSKEGKFISGPWTSSFKRFFPELNFTKYSDIADEVVFPPREPILKREPLVCL